MTDIIESSASSGMRIEANPFRVRAMFAGHVIADTTNALTLYRPGHAPVHFFPLKDVETGYLGRTSARHHDGGLGDATCHTLVMEGEIVEAAVCSYDEPESGAEALRGHLCFAEEHFEVYELTPSDMAAAPRATHVHRSVA